MLYRRVDCPHCGNEITVNNGRETTKCRWCRRLVQVRFTGNGKRAKANVEAIDFPKEQQFDIRVRSYDDWRDDDIYGCK